MGGPSSTMFEAKVCWQQASQSEIGYVDDNVEDPVNYDYTITRAVVYSISTLSSVSLCA